MEIKDKWGPPPHDCRCEVCGREFSGALAANDEMWRARIDKLVEALKEFEYEYPHVERLLSNYG